MAKLSTKVARTNSLVPKATPWVVFATLRSKSTMSKFRSSKEKNHFPWKLENLFDWFHILNINLASTLWILFMFLALNARHPSSCTNLVNISSFSKSWELQVPIECFYDPSKIVRKGVEQTFHQVLFMHNLTIASSSNCIFWIFCEYSMTLK